MALSFFLFWEEFKRVFLHFKYGDTILELVLQFLVSFLLKIAGNSVSDFLQLDSKECKQ